MDDGTSVAPTSLSISSLLANPTASQAFVARAPSARDIPPTYLTDLPLVKSTEFSAYILQAQDAYQRYTTAKQASLERLLGRAGNDGRAKANLSAVRTDPGVVDELSSTRSFSRGPQQYTRSSTSGTELGDEESSVETSAQAQCPKQFFATDFDLRNPRIFDIATEYAAIILDGADEKQQRKSVIESSSLQERLMEYMDVVEMELVGEVSLAEPLFFTAIHDLRELSVLATDLSAEIGSVWNRLRHLSVTQVDSQLQESKIAQVRSEESSLVHAVEQYVAHNEKLDEKLENASCDRFDTCLESQTTLTPRTIGTSSQPLRMSKVIAKKLRDYQEKLQLHLAREKKHLLDVLATDVERAIATTHIESGTPVSRLCSEELIASFGSLSAALIAAGSGPELLREYQQQVIRQLKATTKAELPSSEDSDSMTSGSAQSGRINRSAALAKAISGMAANDFRDMFDIICKKSYVLLIRVAAHQKLFIDALTLEGLGPGSAEWHPVLGGDFLVMLVDVVMGRLVKIINVRTTAHRQDPFDSLQRLWSVARSFTRDCESLSGQPNTSVAVAVEKILLSRFTAYAEEQLDALAVALDNDTWQAIRQDKTCRSLISTLRAAKSCDKRVALEREIMRHLELSMTIDDGEVVTDEGLWTTSALIMLGQIRNYLSIAIRTSYLRNATFTATVRHLRLFNSKACQLILGAGATKSAGLERITAKHLAVTAETLRSLGSIFENLDYVYSILASQAPANDLQRIGTIYRDLINAIYDKLVSIISERAGVICRSLATEICAISTTEIAAASDQPINELGVVAPESASEYIQVLVKDTLVLHKVVSKYLTPSTVNSIMQRVILEEQHRLRSALAFVRDASPGIRAQIALDERFYRDRISGAIQGVPIPSFFTGDK